MTEAADEYLTKTERVKLTGAVQAPKQSRWLKDHGIPHKVDGRRIIVSRLHVQAWLENRPVLARKGMDWSTMKM